MDTRQVWVGSNKHIATSNSKDSLRVGQMIQGKVAELHLNQTATISIGNKQVIAQLETALEAKKNYLFQVTSTKGTIQLKKIADISDDSGASIKDMLQRIGVHSTKSNIEFMTQIVNKNIPLNHEQIRQIVNLLETYGSNTSTQSVIEEILANKLPMTDKIYQALALFKETQLGAEMRGLLQSIQHVQLPTSSLTQIQNQLQTFLGVSNFNHNNAIMEEWKTVNEILNRAQIQQMNIDTNTLIKPRNGLSITQDLTTLMDLLKNVVNNNANIVEQLQTIRQTYTGSNIENNLLMEVLAKLKSNHSIMNNSNTSTMIHQLETKLVLANMSHSALSVLGMQGDFTPLQTKAINSIINGLQLNKTDMQMILTRTELLPKLQNVLGKADYNFLLQALQTTDANKESIVDILQKLQQVQLSNRDINTLREFFLKYDQFLGNDTKMIKNQFLQYMQHFIQTSGIQDEAMMEAKINELEQHSLKQSMLVGAQQQSDMLGDKIIRLVNLINGVQMNMLDQQQGNLQLHLQFPGDKFGLTEDIRLQFEGKKKEGKDQIDADYCRILFHLNLAKMKETIIAMSIQKRVVHLTVYNDTEEVKNYIALYKQDLKEKLEAYDYFLSNVTWKDMKSFNQKTSSNTINENYATNPIGGIDYRI